MKLEKVIIAFMLVLTCLVSISVVSAEDNTINVSDNVLSTSISDISVGDISENSVNMNEMSDASKINHSGDKKNNVLSVSSSDKTKDSVSSLKEDASNTFETIQSYINGASSGDTINLNPNGHYYGTGIAIDINKTVIINGNGATLDAQGLSQIFNVSADYVTLKNITFINGKGEYSSEMCNGGAIYWNGADGSINNCSFIYCTATGKYGAGGAICWNGTKGNVTNCNFAKCNANFGGAIRWIGENGTVTNCNFTNCNSTDGGAIGWVGENGTVTNCNFTKCNATNCGAIAWGGENGTVTNCNFTNCTADNFGGAIEWEWVDNGTVTNCNFTNCNATYGGGAIAWNGENGTVTNCNFTNCNATNGGAIHGVFSADITISNCSFTNCTADNFGGANYWDSGAKCIVTNCNFTNCTATNGGANYWDSGAKCIVTNCNFINCNATNGSAIYWGYYGVGNVKSCIFYFYGSFNGQTVIDDLVVNGNLYNPIFADADYRKQVKVNDMVMDVTIYPDSVISNADFGSLAPGVYEAFLMDDHNNTYVLSNNTYTVVSSNVDTVINSSDKVGKVNQTIKVPIIVYNGTNKVPVKNVTITFNGETKVVNVTEGFIELILPKEKGVYDLFIQFDGYDNYNPSNTTVNITVLPLNTIISVDNVIGKLYSKVNINVKVIDENGNSVNGGSVSINIGGKIYTAIVKDGKATFKDVVLPSKTGDYSFDVNYKGTNYYDSSFATGLIKVINNGDDGKDSDGTGDTDSDGTGDTDSDGTGDTDSDGIGGKDSDGTDGNGVVGHKESSVGLSKVSTLPKTGNPLLLLVFALFLLPLRRFKRD